MPDFTFSHTEFPPGMENTPSFPGKQFLQGKEEFTLPDMENEKNMDTCTFTSGSTTLNRLSTLTHSRRVPQNFQQLEMESSNTVALPCFNHNAEATTHMETPKNLHDKGTLSNNLKMDTTGMLTWTLTIRHTDTDIQRKKSTFFQNHQNSDH